MESIQQVMFSLDTNEEERGTFLDIISREGKNPLPCSPSHQCMSVEEFSFRFCLHTTTT